MRALITGIRGFVGPYLANALRRDGMDVCGFAHENDDLELFPGVAGARIFEGDICDGQTVRDVLRECAPDHIYHLAGISDVAASLSRPGLTYRVNVEGTLNLFEAVRELGLPARIVNVSSGLVYGDGGHESGLSEEHPVSMSSPYAVSKVIGEHLAESYNTYGLQIVTARPFNHIGPRQSTRFACSHFARQIALIGLGRTEPVVETGDLETERDFTDVRDVVEAYVILGQKGEVGQVYNVCSSTSVQMADVVKVLCDLSGVEIKCHAEPARMRESDIHKACGNNGKIRKLGWNPKIPLRQTLSDLLRYWTDRLK